MTLLIFDMWEGEAPHLVKPISDLAASIRPGLVIHALWGAGKAGINPIDVPEVMLKRPPQPRLFLRAGIYTGTGNAIPILAGDIVTDDYREIYTLLVRNGTTEIQVAGMAANMCILDRPYGIKQLVSWGLQTVLLRSLTDIVYDEKVISHAKGLSLTFRYIEENWCPTR